MTQTRHSTPPTPCPSCSSPLTGATGVRDTGGPKPNSLGLCTHCDSLFCYDEELRPRPLTPVEQELVNSDLRLIAMIAELRVVTRSRSDG